MPRLDAEPSWCRSNEGKAVLGLIQMKIESIYDSLSDVGEIRVYQRADFQSGSRVLKKVF